MEIELKRIVVALNRVALQCIRYVGSANYPERENHANRQWSQAAAFAMEGKVESIKFEEPKEDDGD